jgi:hypothetical protein
MELRIWKVEYGIWQSARRRHPRLDLGSSQLCILQLFQIHLEVNHVSSLGTSAATQEAPG